MEKTLQEEFIKIIREELVPAMGCTEPIALAYAAARGREALGCEPERLIAKCSGNMIKNVRCVTIPNSGGMTGIAAACILGSVAGDPAAGMEVLEKVDDAGKSRAKELLERDCCSVEFLDSDIPLHFVIELSGLGHTVEVEVRHTHMNIVSIRKDGEAVFEKTKELAEKGCSSDRSKLSLENIKAFADEVELPRIQDIYERQIRYNMDIAYEGISGDYGIGIGRVLRESYADGVVTRMKAFAAAASEARMGGCDMPVIINSGSGNQGIASSVPVIVYAREKNIPKERLYRSLVFSSLLTIYQKEFIGKLSAFCGAVSASCASAAAITYLENGSIGQIKATIDNTLANIPGIICDGAKISCAAKIASAVDAGIVGWQMYRGGQQFYAGDGIVRKGVEETIKTVSRVGREGMADTDWEILRIMTEKD